MNNNEILPVVGTGTQTLRHMGAAENPPEYAGLPTVAGSHVPSGKKVSRSFDNPTGQPPPRLGGGSVAPGCSEENQ